jgi:hypothetical protein
MHDRIHALQGASHGVGVADVPNLELHVGGEIVRRRARVNLRRQVVERPYAVAAREKLVGEMRADEACTARDED